MTEMNEAVNSLTADYAEPMEINSKEDAVSEPVIEDIESEEVMSEHSLFMSFLSIFCTDTFTF